MTNSRAFLYGSITLFSARANNGPLIYDVGRTERLLIIRSMIERMSARAYGCDVSFARCSTTSLAVTALPL